MVAGSDLLRPSVAGRWRRAALPVPRALALDAAAALLLLVLPVVWFNQALWPGLSGKTLLPFDNLYAWEPWHSLNPGVVPHNALLSDLVLQNSVWKLHLKRALADGEFPLWNPDILTGAPFLGAGQASLLYPLSLLFYVLPLPEAFGWFTALQVGGAGLSMYCLGRILGLGRQAALLAAVAFMFSGFFIVSAVFPMVLGAAAWLPLLLGVTERLIRSAETPRPGRGLWRVWLVGAVAVAAQFLAGHPEISYYSLLTVGLYAGLRILVGWLGASPRPRRLLAACAALAAMVGLGAGLAAVQLLPLVETLRTNFREGWHTYDQVAAWAWPAPRLWTLLLPDLFGNPTHHQWFDIWRRQWRPVTTNALGQPVDTIVWGLKNYVEGGQYLGLLSWLLASIGLLSTAMLVPNSRPGAERPERDVEGWRARVGPTWAFAAIALISLLFILGTPAYALLDATLPGFQQLRTPFRWVFPFTVSVAVLAGFGLQVVLETASARGEPLARAPRRLIGVLAAGWLALGALALALVAASVAAPGPFQALGREVATGGAVAQLLFGNAGVLAGHAFASGEMFWSYEALGLARLGVCAVASGLLVGLMMRGSAARPLPARGRLLPGCLALLLLSLDLYSVHGSFHSATDLALSPLSPTGRPPVVDFLSRHAAVEGKHQPWRFTTYNFWGEKTFQANAGMYYGWQDIRGYDSIIPRQYVDLVGRLRLGSDELPYNRVAPFYGGGSDFSALESPLLNLLNVRYIITQHALPNWNLTEIYRDPSIAVYQNVAVLPRAFVARSASVVPVDQQPLEQVDPRQTVLLDEDPSDPASLAPGQSLQAKSSVSKYAANEVIVEVQLDAPGWLVLTDAYAPGWRATAIGAGGAASELPIHRAYGAFRAVYLPRPGAWSVRFAYLPDSFRLGLLISLLSAAGLAVWAIGRSVGRWGRTCRVPDA